MGMVIPIHSSRKFTHEEAEEILPIIRRITERTAARATEIQEQLRWIPVEEPLHRRLNMRLESIFRLWATKVAHLGCEPRGMWLVDFSTGDGWFSWRYGDEGLNFFRSHRSPEDRIPNLEELLT